MSLITLEEKMRTLAAADAGLQAIFGTGPFRWFFDTLPQGYVQKGSCVRVRRVSTVSNYCMSGPLNVEMVRMQMDFLDLSRSDSQAAALAVGAWMTTVDFMSAAQFTSPPSAPRQFANFQINDRSTLEYQLQTPVYVEMVDWRIFNNTNVS